MMLKKLVPAGAFFYWQFAALNFTLLLGLILLGYKLGYLTPEKLERIQKIVMTLKQPEPPPEKLTDAEFEQLQTDEERSRWLAKSYQRVLKRHQDAATTASLLRAAVELEKGLLDSERVRLSALKKTLAAQRKMFEKNRTAWQEERNKKGFLELVRRFEAMDDAGEVAELLLNYQSAKMAMFILAFKTDFSGDVLRALRASLDAKGRPGVIGEILEAMEKQQVPQQTNR